LWTGCLLMVIAAALHSANKPIGGGDTWVAMACGRYTLGSWALEHPYRTWQMKLLDKFGIHVTWHDPFSATSRRYVPHSPKDVGWVNQNWLTHVVFYKMKTIWGENSIVVYKFVQAVLTALFAYWAARVLKVHPLLAGTAIAFGILLSRSFVDLRPNVSTILFAAIMILLLCHWKNHHYWALAWMIPVMIIWANVHGGFIYAIIIFGIMAAGHLVSRILALIWPYQFVKIPWRGYVLLLVAALAVIAIPAIFSPFGWENLAHPFIIATGSDGKIWRDVIEWRPIWDTKGFGNATPYVIFLCILGIVLLLWWSLFFCRPRLSHLHRRHRRKAEADISWPRIDLAQLAIMAVTVAMSVKSRRFIFLGGVVLAPFLAQMTQEIINMARTLRRHKQQISLKLASASKTLVFSGAAFALVASGVMSTIFAWAMRNIYYRPPYDGKNSTVFRRMVGINAQPVQAMKFFKANKIKGIVFNEWTNGGYIPFGQKPKLHTGEPPCKVYIDGRAQAAYHVSHFMHWMNLRVNLPKTSRKNQKRILKIAQSLNISSDDASLYDKLLDKAQKDRKLHNQLIHLARGEPNLYAKLRQLELELLIKKLRLNPNDPHLYDKLIKRSQNNTPLYNQLARLSAGTPKLFDHLLKREEISAALLSLKKSKGLFAIFRRTANWVLVYIDDKNAIFLRKDAPVNHELLQKHPHQWDFPDEFSRNYTLGYNLCLSSKPKLQREGMKLLISVKRFIPAVHDHIYNMAVQLRQYKEIYNYFHDQQKIYKTKVDNYEEFGRLLNIKALISACNKLLRLSNIVNKPQEQQKYRKEIKHYMTILEKIGNEVKEGWLW